MNTIGNSSTTISSKFRIFVLLFCTALALVMLAGPASAAVTLDVQPSGGTYNSIQDAIVANTTTITAEAVVIRVAEGVYEEQLDFSYASDLTIEGGWNSAFTNRDTNRATVVYGNNSGSVIDAQDSSVIIDGLTITRGGGYRGGGIEVDAYEGSSNLTLRNSKVVRNWSDNDGGGGIWAQDTNVVIENSEIAHNLTLGDDDDYNGGGLYVSGGTLVVRDSNIHDNNATADPYDWGDGRGGGLYLDSTSATIEKSRILDNGALYDSGQSHGGGIYSTDSNLSLINTLVAGNSAFDDSGGGLYFYQGAGADLTIVNSTFSNNLADSNGGGAYIYAWGAGDVDIRNSVFWGNLEPNDLYLNYDSGSTSVTVTYSDIGDAGGDAFDWGTTNTDQDPLFVNSTDDFRLRAGSPAMNTATSVGAPATDIDGVARPQGAGVDMGAFEGPILADTTPPTTSISTPYISSTVSKGHKGTMFKVAWNGADPAPSSGGLLYDVWYKIGDSGKWQRWLDWTTTTSRHFHGQRGKTYYFKVKAKDAAGNEGAFSGESLTLVPFAGRRGSYIKSRHGFGLRHWSKGSSKRFLRTQRVASAKGESILFRFRKTNQISVLATTGPGHGKFKVLVDGVNKGTVDTKSATKKHRQVVYTIDFAGFGAHEIKLINLGTAGRPAIELDGIAVKR